MQGALFHAFGEKVPKAVTAAVDIILQLVRWTIQLLTFAANKIDMGIFPPSQRPVAALCSIGNDGTLIVHVFCSGFGTKVVPAKPILAALPALFDAKQDMTRDAVKRLTVRLQHENEFVVHRNVL